MFFITNNNQSIQVLPVLNASPCIHSIYSQCVTTISMPLPVNIAVSINTLPMRNRRDSHSLLAYVLILRQRFCCQRSTNARSKSSTITSKLATFRMEQRDVRHSPRRWRDEETNNWLLRVPRPRGKQLTSRKIKAHANPRYKFG